MFGQVETLSVGAVGFLAIGFGAFCALIVTILTGAVAIKSLMRKEPVPVDSKRLPVTQSDLDAAMEQLKLLIGNLASRESVTVISARLASQEKEAAKFERWTHTAVHQIMSAMNAFTLQMRVVMVKLDIPMPTFPETPNVEPPVTGYGPNEEA